MVKVGDRIRILRDYAYGASVKKGDEFTVKRIYPSGSVVVSGSPSWSFGSDSFEVISITPKDPIEYLKSAHADGDLIDPATMLRECFGITKTERVVVEWSELRREIKVGDKVRIVGDSIVDWKADNIYKIGDIATVSEAAHDRYRLHLTGGLRLWFPPSSVELV